jgi:hypothetical protein
MRAVEDRDSILSLTGGMAMTVAITRDELDAAGLRKAAARSRDARAARRMLALAMLLEGTDRRTTSLCFAA